MDVRKTRKVSNSEVITFHTCKQRYHLSFDLNLEPKKPGDAIYRGTVGHAMLEAYYKPMIGVMPAQKTPQFFEACEERAWQVFHRAMVDADMGQAAILAKDLRPLMTRYFLYAKGYGDHTWQNSNQRDWIILQVEVYYDLDLTDDFMYVARVDLVARIGGKVTIVDHKFVYNFWNQDKLDLNPQLPKYVGILRNNGKPVDQVMVNQIRYRDKKSEPYTDEEKFRYSFSIPTDVEIRTHLKEQILVSRDVSKWRDLPIEERARLATRVLNDMVCTSCQVKSLCIMGLKGIDFANEITVAYQPNTYDYNSRALEEAGAGY
jgi:hypothetical protein